MNTFFVQELFGNPNLAEILSIQYYLSKFLHLSISEQDILNVSEFQFFWEKLKEENEQQEYVEDGY